MQRAMSATGTKRGSGSGSTLPSNGAARGLRTRSFVVSGALSRLPLLILRGNAPKDCDLLCRAARPVMYQIL